MDSKLVLYNTLTRRKEVFEPLVPGRVGMYVCGPTVYGDPHLGHARPAVTFDLLFRYLKASGYKVRYVRNITDVGHLEHDADEGEDKIAKKARLEQLEPMEVAHYYTERYHRAMDALNVETPSIEPYASGHIIEQIEFVKRILADGYAYEANGSVYFDVEKYNAKYNYGRLSGRNLDDIVANTRELDGQSDKRHSYDFALWKKASPEHIMRWPSPWGEGFPGWHMECSAMSTRYLGERFDIHGGGMDLMFPHHECEIAQSTAALGHDSARYWLHNNMMTVNGQKMGKSLGNFITLEEFFTGSHPKLSQAYSPMTIRFFVLQAHYRSTLDFSNEALQAAEKGLDRLMKGIETLGKIKPAEVSTVDPAELETRCAEAMADDLNSPMVISALFDWVRIINQLVDGQQSITAADLEELKATVYRYTFDILGLRDEKAAGAASGRDYVTPLVEMLLDERLKARAAKDWAASDRIRDGLALTNGTAVMTGIGMVNLAQARRLLDWAVKASVMLNEVVESYDDFMAGALNEYKLHAGQIEIARQMRAICATSRRLRKREAELYSGDTGAAPTFRHKVQPYYSLRCTPQILGPVLETLEQAEKILVEEFNSVDDNPVVDPKTGTIYHGGNFHGDYVSLEMDKLKIAVTKMTMLAERQLNYLFHDRINETLPPFVNLGKLGLNYGLQAAQFTATSTTAESQTLSNPMYVHSIPNNNDNQDIVSMGTNAAMLTRQVVENGYQVAAIEMLALVQAADYLQCAGELSDATRQLYADIRGIVPRFADDTPKHRELSLIHI